jgi:hypothetical protein
MAEPPGGKTTHLMAGKQERKRKGLESHDSSREWSPLTRRLPLGSTF